MVCPECSSIMEFVVLNIMGSRWICDACGLIIKDGTAHLKLLISTGSTVVSYGG